MAYQSTNTSLHFFFCQSPLCSSKSHLDSFFLPYKNSWETDFLLHFRLRPFFAKLFFLQAKQPNVAHVPKGDLAVYVGEIQKKRFLVPVSSLNQPLFQELLHKAEEVSSGTSDKIGTIHKAEEEFGFSHPMGGLTIPCKEDNFLTLTSLLNGL